MNYQQANISKFIEVPSDCSEVNINAEPEDTNAKVNIYGNSDLTQKENKILISVTAENGEVKIYRLYITRK